MRTWETTVPDGMECVDVNENYKTVTIRGWKGHWKNENGNSTSFEKFLNGEFHDWITEYHGEEVLKQVIDQVNHYVEKS